MKLSVCLAVYNEESTLASCLESVKDLATEIVVVDGGSQDQTMVIAKSFGAKIISAINPPIFHINKQLAIDRSGGDWILQLDADEELSPELKREIKEVITSKTTANGYWIPRKNLFLGRFLQKGGQYPDYTLRLYRKGKGKLPCKSVHEQAIVEGKTGYLENPLIHNADPTFERYLFRFNRYTMLLSQDLQQEKVGIGIFSFMKYFLLKPVYWFVLTYIRHRGYTDGFPGFVFSFFSSLRFPVAYVKFWEKSHAHFN